MSGNRPPINIPKTLKSAVDSEELALFIGAGVSMLGRCPSWNELADSTLKVFKNPAEFDLLKGLSPRIKLSIACSLSSGGRQDIPFESLLHHRDPELLDPGTNRIYESLHKLSNFIVTTNYDKWLKKHNKLSHLSEKPIIFKKEDFHSIKFSSAIVHLHGSLEDPNSMVVTTGDYIDHYASSVDSRGDEHNSILVFLRKLFSVKKVLFIGYSLEELEILEYVIQKAKQENRRVGNNDECKHFIIQGFFSHQRSMQEAMEQYYAKECGIHLIPFERDENDWMQLKDVIEFLVKEIPAKPTTVLRRFKEMEDML